MSINSQEKWLKVQDQGIVKYVLINWVLLTAFPVAIFMSVVRGIIKKLNAEYFISGSFLRSLGLYTILCCIISIYFGIRKWKKYEKDFQLQDKN